MSRVKAGSPESLRAAVDWLTFCRDPGRQLLASIFTTGFSTSEAAHAVLRASDVVTGPCSWQALTARPAGPGAARTPRLGSREPPARPPSVSPCLSPTPCLPRQPPQASPLRPAVPTFVVRALHLLSPPPKMLFPSLFAGTRLLPSVTFQLPHSLPAGSLPHPPPRPRLDQLPYDGGGGTPATKRLSLGTLITADIARSASFRALPLHAPRRLRGRRLLCLCSRLFLQRALCGCTAPAGRHSVNICGMYEQAAHTRCLVNNGFLKQIAPSGAGCARSAPSFTLPVFTPSRLPPLAGAGLLPRPSAWASTRCQACRGPRRPCSRFGARPRPRGGPPSCGRSQREEDGGVRPSRGPPTPTPSQAAAPQARPGGVHRASPRSWSCHLADTRAHAALVLDARGCRGCLL